GYQQLPSTTSFSRASAINNSDVIVGSNNGPGVEFPTYWTPSDISSNTRHLFYTGFAVSWGTGVNDLGQILWEAQPGTATTIGVFDPATETTIFQQNGSDAPNTNYSYHGWQLTNSGFVTAAWERYSFNEYNWRLFNFRNGSRGYSRNSWGWFDAANEAETFTGYRQYGGTGPVMFQDGVWTELGSVEALNSVLNTPLPGNITHPDYFFSINELGEIVTSFSGISPAGNKAGLLKPNPNFVANYNFGQIGASPTYHGILPSLMQVDLRNTNGVSVASNIAARYDSNTGKLMFQIPQALDQPFRVYLRLPKYLGKIYPPLTEPALPPDSTWIPMQDVVQGDQNSDNVIDLTDYTIIVSYFNWDSGLEGWDVVDSSGFAPHDGDVNEDGIVDLSDYTIIVTNFNMIGD
ncbi:MAG: hypothetical protein K8R88_07650, partial [Armatimonadetes bacterium]|nr:hypothetical protein [Armatimonadota bacterium]